MTRTSALSTRRSSSDQFRTASARVSRSESGWAPIRKKRSKLRSHISSSKSSRGLARRAHLVREPAQLAPQQLRAQLGARLRHEPGRVVSRLFRHGRIIAPACFDRGALARLR